jgi:glutaredoxin
VPTKMFVEPYNRWSKKAVDLMHDAGVRFDVMDMQENFWYREILEGLTGEYYHPYLFVDGKPYRGLEGVREYLARR